MKKVGYPRKCYTCKEKYCAKNCPARIKMAAMDTANVKRWAKEHNRLHKQIQGEFRIFSIKCKHGGMIENNILPSPARCFHDNAANYSGSTNCCMTYCPVLDLKRY